MDVGIDQNRATVCCHLDQFITYQFKPTILPNLKQRKPWRCFMKSMFKPTDEDQVVTLTKVILEAKFMGKVGGRKQFWAHIRTNINQLKTDKHTQCGEEGRGRKGKRESEKG